MNPLEMALHSWREQKQQYDKSIKKVIVELSKPIKFLPSPMFQSKMQELKQYLRYHYNYDEDEAFNQIYVHHISNVINKTLMELANNLVQIIGGDVKFWQNKILDIACNQNYHNELSIWEVNKPFEKYTGLSPEFLANLRKKRSLAKHYLNSLTSICKIIDKSKSCHEDLTKIDDSFKKLKKTEEKYYAFVEEIQDVVTSKQTNISQKGKNQAKNNLFLFLKPKEDKTNTLANYKFVFNKQSDQKNEQKLLRGKQYEDLDNIFRSLSISTKSQRQSAYSEASQTSFPLAFKQYKQWKVQDLKDDFFNYMKKDKLDVQSATINQQLTFIWSKQFYFSYWGYLVKYMHKIDFTQPFQSYESINYDINSEDQYDQLNAEDLGSDDDQSSQQSMSNSNSFVVGDDERDQNGEFDAVYHYKPTIGYERWSKITEQLGQYEIICPFSSSKPYFYQELIFDEEFSKRIEGKSKQEIISLVQNQNKHVSKMKIQQLLKTNFHKKRKHNKVVYHKNNLLHPDTISQGEQEEPYSDEQDTTLQFNETSMTFPSRPYSITLRSKTRVTENKQKNGGSQVRQKSIKSQSLKEKKSQKS